MAWDGSRFIAAIHAGPLWRLKYLDTTVVLVTAPSRLAAVQRAEQLARSRRWPALRVANAMVIAMPGRGAQYLMGARDADDNFLMGENTYSVHFPPNAPAANYWSVVLYDADTRGLLDNGEPFPSIASNTGVQLNADGSADLYFGPQAPDDPDANWIKTVPGRGYFLGVRFYSPTQAFFDQTWKPDNIEKVDGGGQ